MEDQKWPSPPLEGIKGRLGGSGEGLSSYQCNVLLLFLTSSCHGLCALRVFDFGVTYLETISTLFLRTSTVEEYLGRADQ